ncbi:MAG: hypothetical protein K9K82_10140 [Desulfobacteraceae bacterium]|nr:hypothetical protein [Desulfobacteraceae bacterium]
METIMFFGQFKTGTTGSIIINNGIKDIILPRSQIKAMRHIRGSDYEIVIPYWIAKNRGIV